MDVIHGPRRSSPGTYDAWLALLRDARPRFEFTDPPLRHSLPMTLSFAATATRPIAVLTDPLHLVGGPDWAGPRQQEADSYDMVRVGLARHPLTATAAVAWSGDLPRELQQVLFDTADTGRHRRPVGRVLTQPRDRAARHRHHGVVQGHGVLPGCADGGRQPVTTRSSMTS